MPKYPKQLPDFRLALRHVFLPWLLLCVVVLPSYLLGMWLLESKLGLRVNEVLRDFLLPAMLAGIAVLWALRRRVMLFRLGKSGKADDAPLFIM